MEISTFEPALKACRNIPPDQDVAVGRTVPDILRGAKPFEVSASAVAETLSISLIRRDGDTQGRVAVNQLIVEEYARLIKAGIVFPPVKVWFDGVHYWLSDGFQRIAAAELLDKTTIGALVARGTLDDARWDSYAANSSHGFRRSRADTENVIQRALEHPRSGQLSNNELARHLNIPEATLRRWRVRISPLSPQGDSRLAVRNGTTYVINTQRIGQKSNSTRDAPHSMDECKRGLRVMKELASPRAMPMFDMLEKWARGRISVTVCLEGIESILG